MNYNLLSYLIYGCITICIIYYVGKLFHQNGKVFILLLFHQNKTLTDTTNNLLLMAYYLFNIGYSIFQFSSWKTISAVDTMIATIGIKIGLLIIILAITHYFNMSLIYILSKKNINQSPQNLKS